MRKSTLPALSLLFLTTCVHTRLPPVMPHLVPSTCGDAPVDISAVTYNAAIAPGMNPLSTPRLPYVVKAIAATDFDVLCLQEVWPYGAANTIFQTLGLPTDHVAYSDTRGANETGEDVCSPGDLDGVRGCVKRECAGYPDEDAAICAVDHCESKLLPLYLFNRSCFNCLAASVGKSVDGIIKGCTKPAPGLSRLYGGTNGIMLFSRWPLENVQAVELPSSSANRVALFARVRPPGRPPVEIACTHISSPQRVSPTNRTFSNWEEEQKEQFRIISEHLQDRGPGRPHIFLGDMNFSRGHGDMSREQSGEAWDLSVRSGFSSPAAGSEPALCSVCEDNSFRRGSDNRLIDHVMYRNPPRTSAAPGQDLDPVCVERLFTEPIVVSDRRREVMTHLSDHYGIRVKFRMK